MLRKLALAAVLSLAVPMTADALEQKIVVNLPAYELRLENSTGETHSFYVSIGKGARGRRATPIGDGYITDKREKVVFRYGRSYPERGIKANSVIYWTRTFDDAGNPEEYKMPYDDMRGLGMQLKDQETGKTYVRFVIHSTTDEFTLGTPSSSGCIRMGMDDMVSLYDLVTVENVPTEMIYDLVEIQGDEVTLHADVYNKGIDVTEQFFKEVELAGYESARFDKTAVHKAFSEAQERSSAAHKDILDILANEYPDNFITQAMRDRLHETFPLQDLVRDSSQLLVQGMTTK